MGCLSVASEPPLSLKQTLDDETTGHLVAHWLQSASLKLAAGE